MDIKVKKMTDIMAKVLNYGLTYTYLMALCPGLSR